MMHDLVTNIVMYEEAIGEFLFNNKDMYDAFQYSTAVILRNARREY